MDDSYARGGVALAAPAPGGPGVAVTFDDLAVWPLRDEAGTAPESSTPGKPTPAVTPTPAPHAMTDPPPSPHAWPPSAPSRREFADDFRRDAGRWALIETDGGVTTRTDQALCASRSAEPDTLVWKPNDGAASRLPHRGRCHLVEGEPAGEMGIIFRQQDSANLSLCGQRLAHLPCSSRRRARWRDLVPWTQLETTLIVPGVTARLGVLAEGDAPTLLVDGGSSRRWKTTALARPAGAGGRHLRQRPAVASFDNVDIWILTDIVAPSPDRRAAADACRRYRGSAGRSAGNAAHRQRFLCRGHEAVAAGRHSGRQRADQRDAGRDGERAHSAFIYRTGAPTTFWSRSMHGWMTARRPAATASPSAWRTVRTTISCWTMQACRAVALRRRRADRADPLQQRAGHENGARSQPAGRAGAGRRAHAAARRRGHRHRRRRHPRQRATWRWWPAPSTPRRSSPTLTTSTNGGCRASAQR